ncbi:MAG: transcription-repair coupling factor, partial [Legionellales bacterium]|nr:transcription-repair coupling factor [Legionellales bacterium]
QVYYLYNEVAKINIMAEHLQQLLPDIRIVVAHGQMPKSRLAQAMTRFYQKRAELCLCSTIVESGIDIPNANTIIIDRADKLGLAQLHQIRGRVGRSSHQAYAYLFTLDKKLLNADAKQRLAAISKHNSLGSGFQLAILDMEIRGAGELLGKEQSGHIKELGFDYYISLINDTTAAISENKELTTALELQCKVDINTYFPIIIPESYIPNPATRLQIYKKLASIKDDDTKFARKNELEDIHGKPPESCLNLIEVNHLKRIATHSNIKTINFSTNNTEIIFSSTPNIDTEKLIDLVSKHPHTYKIKGSTKLEIKHETTTPFLQIEHATEFLKDIAIQKNN